MLTFRGIMRTPARDPNARLFSYAALFENERAIPADAPSVLLLRMGVAIAQFIRPF